MPGRKPWSPAALAVVLCVTAAACSKDKKGTAARPSDTSTVSAPVTTEAPEPDRPRGGSARVGVWGAPDVAAPTIGGAACRTGLRPLRSG